MSTFMCGMILKTVNDFFYVTINAVRCVLMEGKLFEWNLAIELNVQ